ncbi:hypothetical protein BGZ60DRAFT_253993 [Tricladium varicosporioides]|nr:hypothetical protein BGZ60DRAFT_253993 [Hymenoscyphus varicosporioides]
MPEYSAEAVEAGHEIQTIKDSEEKPEEPHGKLDVEREVPTLENTILQSHIQDHVPAPGPVERTRDLQEESSPKKETPNTEDMGSVDTTKEESLATELTELTETISDGPQKEPIVKEDFANRVSPVENIEASNLAEEGFILPEKIDIDQKTPDVDGHITKQDASSGFVSHATAQGKSFDEDNHPIVDESLVPIEESKREAEIREVNHQSGALDILDPADTKHTDVEELEEAQHPKTEAESAGLAVSDAQEQPLEVDTTSTPKEILDRDVGIEHGKEYGNIHDLGDDATSTGLEEPEDREKSYENDILLAQEESEDKDAKVEHVEEPEETLTDNSSPEHAKDHLIAQDDHVVASVKGTAEEHSNESNNLAEADEGSIIHEEPGDAGTGLPSQEENSSFVSQEADDHNNEDVPTFQHLSNGLEETEETEHNESLESDVEEFNDDLNTVKAEVNLSQGTLHDSSNEVEVETQEAADANSDRNSRSQEPLEGIARSPSAENPGMNITQKTDSTLLVEEDSEKPNILESTDDNDDVIQHPEPEKANEPISHLEHFPDQGNTESERNVELPAKYERDFVEETSLPETEGHPLASSYEAEPAKENLNKSIEVEPEAIQAIGKEPPIPESHNTINSSHERSPEPELVINPDTTQADGYVLSGGASDLAHQIPAAPTEKMPEVMEVPNTSGTNPVEVDLANGGPSTTNNQDSEGSVDPAHERLMEFTPDLVSEQLSMEDVLPINQVSAKSHEKEPESENIGPSHEVLKGSSNYLIDNKDVLAKAITVVEEGLHPREVVTEAENPSGEPYVVALEVEENGCDHDLLHPIEHLTSKTVYAGNTLGEIEAESEPVSFVHEDAKKSFGLPVEHVLEESPISPKTTAEKTDEKPTSEGLVEGQLSKVLTASETESSGGKEDTSDDITPDEIEVASETHATGEHAVEPESIPQPVPPSTDIEEHPRNQSTVELIEVPKAEESEHEVISESPEIPPRSPVRAALNKELDDQISMPATKTTVTEISLPSNLENNTQAHAVSEMLDPPTQPTDHILEEKMHNSLAEDCHYNDENSSQNLEEAKADKLLQKDDLTISEQENGLGNHVPEALALESIEEVAPMTTLDFLKVNEGDSDGESEATEAIRSGAFMPSEEAWPSHQNLDDRESMHSPIRDHPTVLHEIYEDPEEHEYPSQLSNSSPNQYEKGGPVLQVVERPSTPSTGAPQAGFDHRMAESPVTVMNAENLFDSDDEEEDDDKENDYQPNHLAYGHHEDAHSRDLHHNPSTVNRGPGLFASLVDAIRPDISLVRQMSDNSNPGNEGSIPDYENLLDHGTPGDVTTGPPYSEESNSSLHIRTHTADTVPSFENYAHSDEDSTPSTPLDEIVDVAQDALHHERLIRSSWPVAPDTTNFSDVHEDHVEGNRDDDRGSKPQPSPIHEEFDPYNPQQYPNYMPITPKSSITNLNQAPNSPTTSIRSVRHEEVYRPRDISISPLQGGNSSSTMLNRSPRFPPLNTTTAPEQPYDSPSSRTNSLTDQAPPSPPPGRLRRPTMSSHMRTPNSSPIVPPASTPSSFFQKTRSLFESSSVAQPSSFPTSAVPRPLSGILTAVRGGAGSPKKADSLSTSSRPSSLHRQSISLEGGEGEEEFMPRSLDKDGKPPSPGFVLPQMPTTTTASSRNGSLKASSVHNGSGNGSGSDDADFYTPVEDTHNLTPNGVVGKRKSFLENLGGFGKAVGGLEDSIYNPARDQEARKKEGAPLLGQDGN